MKILYIASEATPFIKIGGLGDVMGSLPQEIAKQGQEVKVILPFYSNIDKEAYNFQYVGKINIKLSWRTLYCGIYKTKFKGVEYYFIDNKQYFDRFNVYGEEDDIERFAFFSKAAIDILEFIDFQPDIINANDWHTALVPIYINNYKKKGNLFLYDVKTVISIHNIEFQGQTDFNKLSDLFGLGVEYLNLIQYEGCLNLLKGAIQTADWITTVSETYANEIQNSYFSHGLDNIIKAEKSKLTGILNGIDIKENSPKRDNRIYKNYSKKSASNKVKNKLRFQKEMALETNSEIPLIGMVTRLTTQKGLDLVVEVMDLIADKNIQLVILGTGYPQYEDCFRNLEYRRHENVRSIIAFSNEYASKIYAAADLFLMPSKSEPCGLSQMIAMNYGSIPIVNTVGGLKDSVQPFNKKTKTGNGITFESYNAYDMLNAIERALELFYNKKLWGSLVYNAMHSDFSWKKSAIKYISLYERLIDNGNCIK